MALVLKDRVQETSTTTGTGTLTLAGAVTQFQTFSSAIGNGNTTYYTIYNAGGSDWEVGLGTVGAGTLSRDTVLSSSNAGALVNFTGTLYVFGDYPAAKASYLDVNGNVNANAFLNTLQTIAATGGTTTLTVSSPLDYLVTGSGGQTIKLPDATTLVNGTAYTFNNNQSSGAITVNNNSNTLIASIPSGGYVSVTLLSNATSAGSWDRHDQSPSNVSWSTNTLDYSGSITSATWNGNNIALNRGGTNASLTASAGSVPYSTASALALSAVGTAGQVLTSAGTSAPTWTTPTTGTVTSVTGTAPVVSSGGNTPAISMPAATGSVNGYLTSTDWTTFNGKGSGTVTGVTATSPVTSSGGTAPVIAMPAATTSVNGYLTSTDWTTFNNKGSGTVTSVAALTLGTTGTDLSSTVATGTTTPVITLNVPTASATNRGVLSSADWTTFNGKGSGTVTSVAQSFTGGIISVGGSPVTTTGTLALTVAGTSGGIPYFSSGTTWATSAALGQYGVVYGGGAGAAPVSTAAGTTGQVLLATTSAAPSWGQVSLTAGVTGTLPIANGGTNATTTPAAMANLIGFTTTATAAGTTTLTNTSTYYQVFTGSTTQTITLPVTSTLTQGWSFHIINNSTGNLTVNSSGSNLLITVLPGTAVMVTCILITGTTAASWEAGYSDFSTATGTGAVVLGTSPTVNNPTVTNYTESVVAIGTVTSSNTIALTSGTVQTATLTASTACTFTMPTATAGKSFILLLKQAASTGNGTATFTSVKWGTAGAPTITATAGKMDILTFVADGTNWYGSIAQGYTP